MTRTTLSSTYCTTVIIVCSNNHYLGDYCDHYYHYCNNNVVTTVGALPPLTGHYTVGPACACAYRWGKNRLRRFESPVTSSSHRLLKDVARPECNALSRAPLSLPSPTHDVIYIYIICNIIIICYYCVVLRTRLASGSHTRRSRLLGSLGVVFLYTPPRRRLLSVLCHVAGLYFSDNIRFLVSISVHLCRCRVLFFLFLKLKSCWCTSSAVTHVVFQVP